MAIKQWIKKNTTETPKLVPISSSTYNNTDPYILMAVYQCNRMQVFTYSARDDVKPANQCILEATLS